MAGRGRELTMPAWMKKLQQQGGLAPPPPASAAAAAPPAPVAQAPVAAYRQQPQYQHVAPPQQPPQYHQAYQQQPPQPPPQPQQYVPMHLQAQPAPAAITVPPQFADAPEPARESRESREPQESRESRSTSERNGSSSKREDSHREKSSRRSRSRSRDRRERSSSRHRRHRSSKSRSSKDRSRSPRDRSRSRDRRRSSRDSSHRRSSRRSSRSRSDSRSRDRIVRRRKKSYFDVRPPGVTEENAAAYAAQAILQQNLATLSGGGGGGASAGAGGLGAAAFAPPAPMAPSPYGPMTPGAPFFYGADGDSAPAPSYGGGGGGGGGGYSQQTRHARRLYVGGIGEVTEPEITEFFNDVIDRALGERQDGGAVVSVYINRERHFAFVELRTIELTTACMNLDGVAFRGMPLKIRRPNDYNPATVPREVGPIPQLNLAALGIVSTTVPDGPGKVFIGGLPYHLNEEQVKELLQAFGPLRSFHLVKELSSNMSKGYGFCEYLDPNSTDSAVLGLNNMQLGDKTLTVRRAMPQENARGPPGGGGGGLPGHAAVGLDMGLGAHPAHAAAMQAMSMAGLTPAATGPRGAPSRVVVLLNMVTPEELEDEEEYADIVDDIKSECERFGRVVSIVLPRPRDGAHSAVGKVFVEYDVVTSAQAAAAELHGRGFSNRTVVVEFMDEQQYARREFA